MAKPPEQRQKIAKAKKAYWDRTPNRDAHKLKISANRRVHGTKKGYRWVYVLGRGYVAEHRLIIERQIGRPLATYEQVHHKDENPLNNDPSNLELMDNSTHHVHHIQFRQRDPKTGRLLPKRPRT